MNQDISTTEAPDRKLLDFAWTRHKVYSKNASRYRSRFSFLRNLLLVLSVVVVTLSVIDASLAKLELAKTDNLNQIEQAFFSINSPDRKAREIDRKATQDLRFC